MTYQGSPWGIFATTLIKYIGPHYYYREPQFFPIDEINPDTRQRGDVVTGKQGWVMKFRPEALWEQDKAEIKQLQLWFLKKCQEAMSGLVWENKSLCPRQTHTGTPRGKIRTRLEIVPSNLLTLVVLGIQPFPLQRPQEGWKVWLHFSIG